MKHQTLLVCALLLWGGAVWTSCRKEAASLTPAPASDNTKTGYIRTPEGLLPAANVHEIPPGYHLAIHEGHIFKVHDQSGQRVEDFGEFHGDTTLVHTLHARARQFSALLHASGETGASANDLAPSYSWVTWAYGQNTNGMVNSFSTTWTVPNPPTTTADNQLIYIWNGMEPGYMQGSVMQPVLQWGSNMDAQGNNNGFGGPFWSISNWYVWGNSGAYTTPVTHIAPGTSLQGVMTGQVTNGVYSYNCSFTGQPNPMIVAQGEVYPSLGVGQTTIALPQIPELNWVYEVLEDATPVTQASDYPPDNYVAMKDINMTVLGQSYANASWTTASNSPTLGEHTVVANGNTNGYGEVDLWFHPTPPPPVAINGQGSYNWSSSGSGSGTITAPAGQTVYVTISGYGPSTGEHLTEFYMSGATLVGSPMGNMIYEDNGSITCHFVMPASGSVTWSGSFTEYDNEGNGDIAVN
ncbi:MAG TPA: hypothetical protein VL547_01705 [Dinghuibacter sp.]|uniref:hypothetical protein n=1 Tax=Dinghuibacter sp. TaxID=2024697 RepID=UPI002CAFB8F5|nr:hypothetical protein [Dinghuibacter sp.]HTJ10704.1 hypothetical protein [Dinghuibacter sp.]